MKFKSILTFYCFIYLATESSANFLDELSKKNCDTPDKIEIYSKWNGGCLSGLLQMDKSNILIFPNTTCPDGPYFKWRFELNGALTTEQPRYSGQLCLDCTLGNVDCVLVSHPCNWQPHQNFFMRSYPNQIDYKNKRSYFSIHSQKHPSRCLTAFEGYHKVEPAYFSTTYFKRHYYQDGAYQAWHSAFRLEECTGATSQSFYFKKNWLDGIEDFLNEVNNK